MPESGESLNATLHFDREGAENFLDGYKAALREHEEELADATIMIDGAWAKRHMTQFVDIETGGLRRDE